MLLRLAADENFDHDIVRGILRRNPEVNTVRVRVVGLSGADDPTVLEWAAREGRVLVTHEVATMTRYAYERVGAGESMPGVFEVSRDVPIGIEEILLIVGYSIEGEWGGQVRYLDLNGGRCLQRGHYLLPVGVERLLHRVVHEVDVELVGAESF